MQVSEYIQIQNNYLDLYVNQYGKKHCPPKHIQGPAISHYYLIYFVTDGEGVFTIHNKSYHLKKGQGFLIYPNIPFFIQANEENPWCYYWLGFNGLQANTLLSQVNLSAYQPVFAYQNQNELLHLFEQFISLSHSKHTLLELKGLSTLYSIFSLLGDSKPSEPSIYSDTRKHTKSHYVHKVVEFIEQNFFHKITISRIADSIGLNRSYLCSLFKTQFHCSIQEYLIYFRINKSCSLLRDTHHSIGDISRAVGYEDPLLFSKTFKKLKGVSPRKYRTEKQGCQ
ncbi:putative DNA-binding protein [Bacillus sp. TS-2]|nr:putative DNA-binding protein [Bacillus sp. TS-2]